MVKGAWSKELDATCLMRWLLPCIMLLAGCDGRQREAIVAQVNGAALTEGEAGIDLRGTLWRRGEKWSEMDETTRKLRRQEALDHCIEKGLLAEFAKQPTPLPASQAHASEADFQQFLKQFEPPDGWQPRFELQGLKEVQVRESIAAEVAQGDAIETWLKAQRAQDPESMEMAARLWFEHHREQLRIPERARISHLFLTVHDKEKPDRGAEVAELHRKLAAGEGTLEDLAAKFSEDDRSKKTGGSLGWITRDRIPVDFAEKVFSSPLKKPSEPFRTKLGWHIVVVHERQAARLPEFAEVKDEIMAGLDTAWREAAVQRLTQELREKAKVVVDEAVLQTVAPTP